MIDVTDVKIEAIEGGYAITPVSEMKKVVIPSPPTIQHIPINPRDVIIYLTKEAITSESVCIDSLKAYAKENKVVLLCPDSADLDMLVDLYQYAISKASKLNIKKNGFSVKSDEASLELANSLVETLGDEGADLDDAEIFSF